MKNMMLACAVLFFAAFAGLRSQALTVINNAPCAVKLDMFYSDDMCTPVPVLTQILAGNGATTVVSSPNGENWVGARVAINTNIRVSDPDNCNSCSAQCGAPPTILSSQDFVPNTCADIFKLDWTGDGCASGSATLVITPL